MYHRFNVYNCRFICIVASCVLFFFFVPSNGYDDLLWDPNSTLEPGDLTLTTTTPPSIADDLGSGLDLPHSDDSADFISFNILGNDDDQTIFPNTASAGSCAATAAATDDDIASDFSTIKARDDRSCPSGHKESSSSPILSPETIQLFQDPNTATNSLLISPPQPPSSTKKKKKKKQRHRLAAPAGLGLPKKRIPSISRSCPPARPDKKFETTSRNWTGDSRI